MNLEWICVKGDKIPVRNLDVCFIKKQKKSKRSLEGKNKYLILLRTNTGCETSYKVKRRSNSVINRMLPHFTKTGKRLWIKMEADGDIDFKMRINDLTQTISEMKTNLNSIIELFNQQNRYPSLENSKVKRVKRGKRQRKTKKETNIKNKHNENNKNNEITTTIPTFPFSQLYPHQLQQAVTNNCEDGEDEDSEVFYKK